MCILLEFEQDATNNDDMCASCPGLKEYTCSDNQAYKPEPNLNQMEAEKNLSQQVIVMTLA